MKFPLNLILIVLSATFFSVSINGVISREVKSSALALPSNRTLEQQQAQVTISLPDESVVTMSDGVKHVGRVVQFGSSQIVIQNGTDQTSLTTEQVEKVTFDRNAQFYLSSGVIVLRGGNSSSLQSGRQSGNQETWTPITLQSFQLVDGNLGQVNLELNSRSYRGSLAVAQDSTYVADEILLNHTDRNISVLVTPWSVIQ